MIIKVLVTCCALAVPLAGVAAEPAQDGMTVVRDPHTGKLRAPTAAELRALRATAVDPQVTLLTPQPPKSTVRADGTRTIHLGDRGMVYSVMRRNADGTLTGHCVKGEEAAAGAIDKKQETDHEHL